MRTVALSGAASGVAAGGGVGAVDAAVSAGGEDTTGGGSAVDASVDVADGGMERLTAASGRAPTVTLGVRSIVGLLGRIEIDGLALDAGVGESLTRLGAGGGSGAAVGGGLTAVVAATADA